jgi:nucleoid-associated protein YgaU
MRKFLWIISCAFISLHLAGCGGWLVRTSTSRQPRVDQQVSGNRGFVHGSPTSPPKEPAFKDRRVYRVELEVPPSLPKESKPQPLEKKSIPQAPREDKALWGNRGYLVGGPVQEARQKTPETLVYEETPPVIERIPVPEVKPKEISKMRTYTVKKGDTLQKISRKFYGTTKKWPLLYKTNKDRLKSQDRVYPGQVLDIPEVGQYKK